MCKRFISILLISALIVTLTACSQIVKKNTASDAVISPNIKDGQAEINILYYNGISLFKNSNFIDYTRKFEKQYGVKVNLKAIGDGNGSENDMENFQKKMNTYLYEKKGPELIFGNNQQANLVKLLIKQSAVVDLKDKIPNIKKIYDALLDKEVYYVPIGMDYTGSLLNKKVLEELGINELETDWSYEDYVELREKWLTYSQRYFTIDEFNYISDRYLWQCRLYDVQSKKVTINTLEVKNAINSIRNIIYSNYKLNNDYTYKNYYNMLYEPMSEEGLSEKRLLSSKEYKQESLRAVGSGNNSSRLYARQIQDALESGLVLMPDFKEDQDLFSYGFLVNKNGNNLELAYEFINGLLEDKTQMDMLKPDKFYQYYPVNKEIEEEIIKAESQEGFEKEVIEIKESALNRIKEGHAHLFVLKSMDNPTMIQNYQLYERLKKQMIKYLFADTTYSNDALDNELKRLEAEYTIWLNE